MPCGDAVQLASNDDGEVVEKIRFWALHNVNMQLLVASGS